MSTRRILSLLPLLVLPTGAPSATPQSLSSGGGAGGLAPAGAGEVVHEEPLPAAPWKPGAGPPCVEDASRLYAESAGFCLRPATGELVLDRVDVRIPGVGFDFVWAMRYRSRPPASGASAATGVTSPSTSIAQDPVGHGWDVSYHLAVEPDPRGLVLRDGLGRRPLFEQEASGDYVHDELLLVGQRRKNGSFRFAFPDGGAWLFRPLDGSAAEGKVFAIVDRAGNRMGFEYDAAGRLVKVLDTLAREVLIAYDAEGRVSSLTDWSGRSWKYAYYRDGDAGGSEGDLKSVTTPAVLGTPNGNDFPNGKTTTYTYSRGFSNPERNHDLLSVTNAQGETWLRNVYSVAAPGELEFDRVVRQVWGAPGDVVDLAYASLGGQSGDEGLVVVENDRRGIVTERFYDPEGRLLRRRDHTGFADPDLPTTADTNRPSGPLRPGVDPAFWETAWAYGARGRVVRIRYPAGNVEIRRYDDAGNLVLRRREPGPRGGSQAELTEHFEYGSHGFPTRRVDAAGAETRLAYDAEGNLVQLVSPDAELVHDFEYDGSGRLVAHVHPRDAQGRRRRDELSYHAQGPEAGYLASRTLDVSGFALTTGYRWDVVGNLVGVVDPQGGERLLVRNSLNQVVLEQSPEVGGAGVRYTRERFFDAADRVIREDVENLDETGAPDASNPVITTEYEHGILGELLAVVQELDEGSTARIEYAYDANRNRTLVRTSRATSGEEPNAKTSFFYDERDLPFLETRGEGAAGQSTTRLDLDANSKEAARLEGLEETPRRTERSYDGYGREIRRVDPMGNVLSFDWGPTTLRGVRLEGELVDRPGSAGNVPLASWEVEHDVLRRPVRITRAHFERATGTALGTGRSDVLLGYAGWGHPVSVTDPNGNECRIAYDSLGRPRTITDPMGNTTSLTYGDLGRVVEVSEEHAGDASGPHVRSYEYDELGRLVLETNPGGESKSHAYDSRGLLRRSTDGRGNVVRREYDGVGHLIELVRELTDDGTGGGVPAGEQVTSFEWAPDLPSWRMRIDDNGNATTREFDALGRLRAEVRADGTRREWSRDLHDEIVGFHDPNGSVLSFVRDLLGRTTSLSVSPGPGVSLDSTAAIFEWDGTGALVTAADEDSRVTRELDSLGALLAEVQSIGAGPSRTSGRVAYEVDAAGLPVSMTYPGSRTIELARDALNRVASIADAGAGIVVDNLWVGPGLRSAQRSYGNGLSTTLSYDGALRPARAETWSGPGHVTLADRRASWDASGGLASRENALPGGTSFFFTKDSLGRLLESTELPGAGAPSSIAYSLDDVASRLGVAGGAAPGVYVRDATLPSPGDWQRDQYTSTPFDAREYDDNGNLSRSMSAVSVVDHTFDFANRLVERVDGGTGEVTRYAYDALGRRIAKVRDAAGAAIETRSFHAGRAVIEEQDAQGTTLATFVPDTEVGRQGVASFRRDGVDYWLHPDGAGNVAALTDADGAVVESYEYGDFGDLSIFDSAGLPAARSAHGNVHLFQASSGWRLDEESGLFAGPDERLHEPRSGRAVNASGGILRVEPTDWDDHLLVPPSGDLARATVSWHELASRMPAAPPGPARIGPSGLGGFAPGDPGRRIGSLSFQDVACYTSVATGPEGGLRGLAGALRIGAGGTGDDPGIPAAPGSSAALSLTGLGAPGCSARALREVRPAPVGEDLPSLRFRSSGEDVYRSDGDGDTGDTGDTGGTGGEAPGGSGGSGGTCGSGGDGVLERAIEGIEHEIADVANYLLNTLGKLVDHLIGDDCPDTDSSGDDDTAEEDEDVGDGCGGKGPMGDEGKPDDEA